MHRPTLIDLVDLVDIEVRAVTLPAIELKITSPIVELGLAHDHREPENSNQAAGYRRLGDILVATHTLTADQLATGLQRQQAFRDSHRYYFLGSILVGLGFVTVNQVYAALTIQRAMGDNQAAG